MTTAGPPLETFRHQPATTDPGWLVDLRAVDPDAWERLVDQYGPDLYRICRAAGLDAATTADIVQDVFASVLTNVDRFEKTESHHTFRGWLRTIVRNRVRDFFRRRRNGVQAVGGTTFLRRLGALAAGADSVSGRAAEDLPFRGTLSSALESIRPHFGERTWQAFRRTVIENGTSSEVARELGMTPNGVRMAKARVLNRLRREIDIEVSA